MSTARVRPVGGLAAAAVAAAFAILLTGSPAAPATAEADRDVQIRKLDAVRISGLSDFIFPVSMETPAPLTDQVCVFSTASGRYQITATSANASGRDFRLAGDGGIIVYHVAWRGTGGYEELDSGRASDTMGGGSRTSPSCGGGTNASIRVSLDPATYAAALPGIYADTLTITVAPD